MTEPVVIASTGLPPDHRDRSRALDPTRSFLVQAPAGSGKTYLLTQRFLRLLGKAEKPEEIVAITFTNAAAAEMRNRVLKALEEASLPGLRNETLGIQEVSLADGNSENWSETWGTRIDADSESLEALAWRAMERSRRMGWRILDQPARLRITTIDAFCRGLALECPLSWGVLAGLGGRLEPVNKPEVLYKRAATRTVELLRAQPSAVRESVEKLLLWRDNNWSNVEELIVEMLGVRNRWYQEFVFARDRDWTALRARLEAPFCRAARGRVETLGRLLDGLPGSREYALKLARMACEAPGRLSPVSLAERAELPEAQDLASLEDAVAAYRDLADFLLTKGGEFRKKGGLHVHHGFPATPAGKAAKDKFGEFVDGLAQEAGLAGALAAFQQAMPLGYTEEEWELMRHCFAVLREAAGQLQLVFAETGSVDFTEVAQIALQVLRPVDGFPSDFAMRQADSIRHLLMDEFQDTSRNQHQLLAWLIGAWPEREGRSCFCVGDPMQSIYGFREAEVELFERLKTHGLEIGTGLDAEPFRFEYVSLAANFRTVPSLVEDLNRHFRRIFAEDDGSGVQFSPAVAARAVASASKTELHLGFTASTRGIAGVGLGDPEETQEAQLEEMVALIREKLEGANPAQGKFRVAVLGRTRRSLVVVAQALREAGIGFRAVELVELRERPEVVDALALMRALLNPVDRTAWLGVLRAPWCGLSLEELHALTSGDEKAVKEAPAPVLLETRLPELLASGRIGSRGFAAAERVGRVLRSAVETRAEAASVTLGTWVEAVWKVLGGEDTVDREQRENLGLLWGALDKLPDGELDLMGPGLAAGLDSLFALPDPAASSEFGVQLMTIHKSKGLEFEVVIVPDLEARGMMGERRMISWLERGLADADGDGGALTEFLIAPIQTKGADAGAAKTWVDGVKRERETQELRRVLYVAATRAREELHLFARPRFSVRAKQGGLVLAKPAGLLATAWPALGEAVEAEFDAWLVGLGGAGNLALAAAASPVVAMPAAMSPVARATRVRRLPEGYSGLEVPGQHGDRAGQASSRASFMPSSTPISGDAMQPLFARTEGGLRSRLEGTAIHGLMEQLSRLRRTLGAEDAARALAEALPGVVAMVRGRGLPQPSAQRVAEQALAVAQRAAVDGVGAWIVAPHAEAETEARWTGLVASSLDGPDSAPMQWRSLRPDRVFRAARFGDNAEPVWWIVDYKTSQAGGADLTMEEERRRFLAAHREQHGGQLAAYAQVLRGLLGEVSEAEVRTGIYYPRLLLFDWWAA